jgi:amino acid transporter
VFAKVLLGSFFIIGMALVSARGIVVSERVQNVLIAIQVGVLIVVSIIALIRVFAGNAGAQAITAQLSWLWPAGLDASSIAAVITTLILVCTYVLVAFAVQSFAGFGDTGIGLNNAMNTDDALTVLGKPVAGAIAASLLLLTVSVSALSSTQTTTLPTARGTLSLAVHEAIPKRFAKVHPRYMTPAFGTIVMGLAALFFYLLLTFLSENALADSVASLGLAVAFYYGITAYSCVWYFRNTLFFSVRNLFFRGIFPLLGALAMTWAFVQSAIDMIAPDYGYTAFGPLGGVFVLGVGMLVLGIPLMLARFAFGTKRFFRGETLTAETEVRVPDVY